MTDTSVDTSRPVEEKAAAPRFYAIEFGTWRRVEMVTVPVKRGGGTVRKPIRKGGGG